jgi:transcription-repair coupling factor (superfamily II helicase)
MATAADYLPGDAAVLFCESQRVAERARNYLWQLTEDTKILLETRSFPVMPPYLPAPSESLQPFWKIGPLYTWTPLPPLPIPRRPARCFRSRQAAARVRHQSETAAADLAQYQSAGFSAVVLVASEQRALNLQALLREQKIRSAVDFQLHDLPAPGKTVIAVGRLSAGLEYPGALLAVLSEGQEGAVKKHRRAAESGRQKLLSYADLSPGDLIVHEHHGIGRFAGMVTMQVDGVDKDYVKLSYAGADVLYLPATQLDLISKYIGSGEDSETRKLSKLGGTEWEKTKTKAKKAAKELAEGLIRLYAERQKLPGHAFSPTLCLAERV